MLKLLCQAAEQEKALEFLMSWEKTYGGNKPCVLGACVRCRKPELAWKTYELMTRAGVDPDAMAVGTLLRGLVAAKMWAELLSLCRRALQGHPRVEISSQSLQNTLAQLRAGGEEGVAKELEAIIDASKN